MRELDEAFNLIAEHAVEPARSILSNQTKAAFQLNQPTTGRWSVVLDLLLGSGKFDVLFQTLERLVAKHPNEAGLRLVFAEAAIMVGQTQLARKQLRQIQGNHAIADEVQWMLHSISTDKYTDKIESHLIDMPRWTSEYHLKFLSLLIQNGTPERALMFFQTWAGKHTVNPPEMAAVAEAALIMKQTVLANQLFHTVWSQWMNQHADQLLGEFPESVPAYSHDIEAQLIRKIEFAFEATPEPPIHSLAEFRNARQTEKILFVSYEHGSLENDFYVHMSESARLAGVELDCFLDSALVLPTEFRGSDKEIEQRFQLLERRIQESSPDIVIWDYSTVSTRCIDPSKIGALRRKYGFRFVLMFRDAHEQMRPAVQIWLPVVDTLVAFDDDTVALKFNDESLHENVLVLPVPSLHPPFERKSEPEIPLVFAGSIFFQPRMPFISRLLCEPITFKALFGPLRAVALSDARSYANFLASGRGVLNFSRHGLGVHLMTGRVWETLSVQSVLVEQDNPITRRFLVPYRHYIPWQNVSEVVHIANFLDRRWDIGKKIAAEGHAWMAQHYNAPGFWNRLIQHATRPLSHERRSAQEQASAQRQTLFDAGLASRWAFLLKLGMGDHPARN